MTQQRRTSGKVAATVTFTENMSVINLSVAATVTFTENMSVINFL